MRVGMRAALRVREFRALWLAEAQSAAGDQLATVAVTMTVWDRTGSAWWSSLAFAGAVFVPALAGLLLAPLADRWPRRGLLAGCCLLQALLVAAMVLPGLPLVAMVVLVGLAQSLQGASNAASGALTRVVLVDDRLYDQAQAVRAMTVNALMLAGLAVAGLLVLTVGTRAALLLDAVTYLVAALIVWAGVRARPAAGAGERRRWSGALRLVFAERRLRLLLGLSCLVGTVVVPEGIAAALVAEAGAGPAAIGWLLAADPAGYVLGSFVLSRWVPAPVRRRWLGALAVASPAVLVVFALRPPLAVCIGVLVLSGALGAYQITAAALYGGWVPDRVRGGAIGVARTALRLAQGLGVIAGGALAEAAGSAHLAVVVAGLVGVGLGIGPLLGWRALGRTATDGPGSAVVPAVG